MVVHKCSYCGHEELTMSEIKRHMKKVHNKKKGDEVIIESRYVNKKIYDYKNNWITI